MAQPSFSAALRGQLQQLLPEELALALERDGLSSPALPRALELLRRRVAAMLPLVPAPIARQQLVSPSLGLVRCERWAGSLLFADLSGFTALSEQLSALGREGSEVVTGVINTLFDELDSQIVRYGGALLKFGGDALTAFFSSQELGEGHAALAAAAALDMQQRMAQIGLVETRQGSHMLRLRIGIHSGTAFAAQLGDGQHMELLLTGRDVNRVARAQDVAVPGEVVLTAETLQQLAGVRAVARGQGFMALEAFDRPRPRAPAPLPLPPQSGDVDELAALTRAVSALQVFLPQGFSQAEAVTDERLSDGFRLVTVLFAHVAPLSDLVEQLPAPEAAAPLLNNYYWRMQHAVRQYGGSINKLDMAADGDKLLACFGAPVALEHQQELALRAALEMQREAAEASRQLVAFGLPALHQEIGLNTGHVFAGLVGTSRRREYTVMGDVVNLAARLMASAPAGAIWASPSTQRPVAHLFDSQRLPPISLKGKAQPVEPWSIAGVSASERPRQSSLLARSPLVGRREEQAMLRRSADSALRGQGHSIVLTGEAGVGKSRLIEDLLQWLSLRSLDADGLPPFFLLTTECQSYEQMIPFAALRDLLQQLLRLSAPAVPALDEDFITREVVRLAPDLARFTPLLGEILGVDLGESPLTAALSPEQRRDRTHDLVAAIVAGVAARQPLVLLWEDLHWCDASSLAVLQRLIGGAAAHRLLFLIGMRPEPLAIVWEGHATVIRVEELDPQSGADLVAALLNSAPPPELLERLRTTDEGYNPFFVEELMRTLIEERVLVPGAEGLVVAGDLASLVLPDTIEGVIAARVDRLEARQRETLQIASVIGRHFLFPILEGVADDQATLAQRLSALAEADLILPEENLSYLFKHMLTRDAVYTSILYARRRELHRRVAARIETLYASRIEEQLPLLARHYFFAEVWPKALEYALEAGKRAQDRYHNQEAIAFFNLALDVLGRLPEPQPSHEAEAYERRGLAQRELGNYDQALADQQRALELQRARVPPDHKAMARIYVHSASVAERKSDYEGAFAMVEQGLRLVESSGSEHYVRLLVTGAGLYQRQGRYGEALDWASRALDNALALGHTQLLARAYLSLCGTYQRLGQNRTAIEMGQKSLLLYQELGDLSGQADAQNTLANTLVELGLTQEAVGYYSAALQIKQALGDIYGQAMLANNLGDALRMLGDYERAMEHFRFSLERFQALGSQYAVAIINMNIGSVSLSQQQLGLARQHLTTSETIFKEIDTDTFLSELYRYFARLLRAEGNLAEALSYAQRSLELARLLEDRAEQGLTLRVLGLVLRELAQIDEARAALLEARAVLAEVENNAELARCLDDLAGLAPTPAEAAALQAEAAALRVAPSASGE